MKKLLYILEWVALPFFLWLVIDMGIHGFEALLHGGHEGHAHHGIELPQLLISLGFVAVCVFLWNKTALKHLVPCRHSVSCTHTTLWPHVLATVAFLLHFIPEAHLRAQAFASADFITNTAGMIAFGIHLFVDILVAYTLSLYWPKPWQKILSGLLIVSIWGAALVFHDMISLHSHPAMLFVGAFFLSMFVHIPHKK